MSHLASVPVIGNITLPQAEYEAFVEYCGEFDVVCYQVVYKNGSYLGQPLTPLLETEQQACEQLELIKINYPTARISKQTFFYSSEDDKGRKELIAEIVAAGGEA